MSNKVCLFLFYNKHLKHAVTTDYLIFSCILLAFLEALPHLCQHVNLVGGDGDSRAVLCALIGLMEDSDPAVRISFSQSVRFLLTETSKNSEQDSLNEVSWLHQPESSTTKTNVAYSSVFCSF